MKIDFIEDEQKNQPIIDFIEEKNIPTNKIDFQEEKPPMLQGKVETNIIDSQYDDIVNNKTLAKEQKIKLIKEQGQKELEKINKQHKKELTKIIGGSALQIASSAIPFGASAKLGGQLALKLAKPAFSEISKKAMLKNIGSAIGAGVSSGAMFGAGEALIENKNTKDTIIDSLKGASQGLIGGGIVGGLSGKLATKFGKTKNVIKKLNSKIQPQTNAEFTALEDKLRELIQNRRSNIDLAKFDAIQKIEKFSSQIDDIAKELNFDSKKIREILPFIRENTDLPNKNFYREDLKSIFSKLTNEQKEVLRMIAQNNFDEMEIFWNNLAKVKDLKSTMSPEEYITHIWAMDNKNQEALKNYFKTKSGFEKTRIVPTYKKGIEDGIDIPLENGNIKNIGLTPKTLDYAEIQKLHSHQLIDATENTKFVNALQELKEQNPKYAKQLEDMAKPVIERTNEVETAKNLAGKLLQISGNAYDTVNNFTKGCKFLFNGMHAVALTESAAAHEGILPIKTIKTLGNLPKIIDGIKNNNYKTFKESPAVKNALKDGVQFGAITDINISEFNTFIDGISNLIDKVTLGAGKIVTKPIKTYIDANNKFLWNYLHNTYKLHAYENLIKRVSENGKKILSDNVRKEIGQLVNDTFGGQNWDALGIKPETLKFAKRTLLSPDWNMSATIRQSFAIFSSEAGQKFLNEFAKSSKIGSATRELSRKLGLSSFTNDIRGAGVRGQQARKYFMTFLIQTAIYSNLINACNRKIDSIKNPDKYEDGINYSSYSNNRFTEKDNTGKKIVDTLFPKPYIGNNEYGREIYARIGKQALEIPEIIEDMPNSAIRKIASKSSPLVNPVVTKLSDEATNNWNKAGVKERYKEVFTPFSLSKKDKFKPIDMFYSTTKGVNSYQARAYLKECILEGDIEAIEKFKLKMKANKIDFNRAMERVYKELEEEDYGIRRN